MVVKEQKTLMGKKLKRNSLLAVRKSSFCWGPLSLFFSSLFGDCLKRALVKSKRTRLKVRLNGHFLVTIPTFTDA